MEFYKAGRILSCKNRNPVQVQIMNDPANTIAVGTTGYPGASV